MSPGPPPRDPQLRRRRNAPRSGEWIDLPATVGKPILPALPRRTKAEGPWSARTRATWSAWRKDPATTRYTPADIEYAISTILLAELANRKMTASLLAELRLRMNGLGLTPPGKQRLRWRIGEPAEVVELDGARRAKSARQRRRLQAIDPNAKEKR